MATVLTWAFDGATEGAVNAAGNIITLSLKVSGDVTQFGGANPKFSQSSFDPDKVGPIRRWRYDSVQGALREQTSTTPTNPDGHVVSLFGFDMSAVQNVGLVYWVTFKVAIELDPTWLVSVHPRAGASPSPEILRLMTGWMTLYLKSGLEDEALEFNNIGLDVDIVGRLPDPSGHLKLNVDSEAAWVRLNAGASPLTDWFDLSAAGNDLEDVNDPVLSDARPHVDLFEAVVEFDGTAPTVDAEKMTSTAPGLNGNATFAAVFRPDPTTSSATIVGRYNSPSGLSWRMYYTDNGAVPPARSVVFQAKALSVVTNTVPLDATDDPVLVVFRRTSTAGTNLTVWVNGRPQASAASAYPMLSGSGPLYVGARETSAGPTVIGDGFMGEINQVALYSTSLDELALSLVMHEMASRTLLNLGTPIPALLQSQPFGPDNADPKRRLARRPIAVITLYSGNYDSPNGASVSNRLGQSTAWRSAFNNSATADVEALKNSIREALNGCDQFEIMFNRPGGRYADDVVTSYPFGQTDDTTPIDIVTANQWTAMADLWTFFNLWDYGDDNNRNVTNYKQRRGWFYTGAGLPVNDADGTFDNTGHLGRRQVAPVTPGVYYDHILEPWTTKNARYCCLMVDAAVVFFGKFVEVCHDATVMAEFTLVGEAIPTDEAARKGAPWFAMPRLVTAPWWKLEPITGLPSRLQGYNFNWTNDWNTQPVYFGIQPGLVQNITGNGIVSGNDGNDLPIGIIYSLTLKGAAPVAWFSGTYQKVGAAWNYATGRVAVSRHVRCPRLMRSARV